MTPIEIVCSHITVGALGEPGERTFYLQGGDGRRLFTLKFEKGQAAVLAERLLALVDELAARHEPDQVEPPPDMALISPVEEDFVVGAMALGYDESADRVSIVCEEIGLEDEDDDEDASLAVAFVISRTRARSLARHADEVVSSGRPPCDLCGFPKGANHICPRSNGRHERS